MVCPAFTSCYHLQVVGDSASYYTNAVPAWCQFCLFPEQWPKDKKAAEESAEAEPAPDDAKDALEESKAQDQPEQKTETPQADVNGVD